MKQVKLLGLIIAVLVSTTSPADDIDIYIQPVTAPVKTYVRLILDFTSGMPAPLCRYGEADSCGLLVLGGTVFNLDDSHQLGDSVSYVDMFGLVLRAVLSQRGLDKMAVALVVSSKNGALEQLTDYITLGESIDEAQGFDRIVKALNTIDNVENWSPLAKFSSYRQLSDSMGSKPQSPTLSDSCSAYSSIIVASDTLVTDEFLGDEYRIVTGYSGDSARPALQNIFYEKLSRALSQILLSSQFKGVRTVKPHILVGALDLNELYVGLFQPQPLSRWSGNVKKFSLAASKLLVPAGREKVVDAQGLAALVEEGELSGHIRPGAIGLWTQQASLSPADEQGVLDGPRVRRGGAGQRIPGYLPISNIGDRNSEAFSRQVFVEPSVFVNGRSTQLVPFNADGISPGSTGHSFQELLGSATPNQAQTLIRWGRGQDVDDEDGDGDTKDARPWILGDVLHSKPLLVNYGAIDGHSKTNPKVRLFFGTGDGVFHGVENTKPNHQQSGREVFAFYPNSTLPIIGERRANLKVAAKMRYGVDGSPSSLLIDNNGDGNIDYASPDNDEAYVYFGLRRGGYSYYALDVSNALQTPSLLWKIDRVEGNDFDELGLTFSKPLVGKVKFSQQVQDVVIFAGGYHGGWSRDYSQRKGKDYSAADDFQAGRSHGNAIYIVNARTGDLIWKAVYGETTSSGASSTNTKFEHSSLVDSIPSAVSALRNPDGVIHRIYVGDTGGAVWRVDLPAAAQPFSVDHRKNHWFISKLAELGSDGKTTDRRFFHAPDIIRSVEDSGEAFDGVIISSGNRANPNELDVLNYHFYLKDHLITSGDDAARYRLPIQIAATDVNLGMVPGTAPTKAPRLADITGCSSSVSGSRRSVCNTSLENGWMLGMSKPGEKSLASPLVDGGRAFFTSYVPAQTHTCRIEEGVSQVYLVHLKDGSQVDPTGRIFVLGEGLASSVQTQGSKLLAPLGGMDDMPSVSCGGKVCDRFAKPLQTIYWREMGVDEI